jgi:hypothetical protein
LLLNFLAILNFKKIKMKFLKKHFRKILIFTILFSIILLPEIVFAATPETKTTWNKVIEEANSTMALLLYITYPLIWVGISFIGVFMDNRFIFGSGIEEVLISTWRLMRDLVNIGFVIVLLAIAFYHVTGLDIDAYGLTKEVKQNMKKFVLAVILVNFSFFAGKVVIDVANVFTTGIFAIPSDIISQTNYNVSELCAEEILGEKLDPASGKMIQTVVGYERKNCKMPQNVLIDFDALIKKVSKGPEEGASTQKEGEKPKTLQDAWKDVIVFDSDENAEAKSDDKKYDFNLKKHFTSNNIFFILAENVLKLRQLPNVAFTVQDTSDLDGMIALFLNGSFSLIFMFLYGVGFIVVAITLLGRAVYIWAFFCFCPIIALTSVFGQTEIMGFGVKKFFDNAFIPVKVALVTTLGFLLIYQFNKFIVVDMDTYTNPGTTATAIDSALSSAGTSGENNSEVAPATTNTGPNGMNVRMNMTSVFNNGKDARKIVFYLMIVILLWKGIEWATKDQEFTSGITQKIWGGIKGWGETITKGAASALVIPYYSPDGAKGKEGVSLGELWNKLSVPPNWQNWMDSKSNDESVQKRAEVSQNIQKAQSLGVKGAPDLTKLLADERSRLAADTDDGRKLRRDFVSAMKEVYKPDASKFAPTDKTRFENYTGGVSDLAAILAATINNPTSANASLINGLRQSVMGGKSGSASQAAVEQWLSDGSTASSADPLLKEKGDAAGAISASFGQNKSVQKTQDVLKKAANDTNDKNEIDRIAKTGKDVGGILGALALSPSMDQALSETKIDQMENVTRQIVAIKNAHDQAALTPILATSEGQEAAKVVASETDDAKITAAGIPQGHIAAIRQAATGGGAVAPALANPVAGHFRANTDGSVTLPDGTALQAGHFTQDATTHAITYTDAAGHQQTLQP